MKFKVIFAETPVYLTHLLKNEEESERSFSHKCVYFLLLQMNCIKSSNKWPFCGWNYYHLNRNGPLMENTDHKYTRPNTIFYVIMDISIACHQFTKSHWWIRFEYMREMVMYSIRYLDQQRYNRRGRGRENDREIERERNRKW